MNSMTEAGKCGDEKMGNGGDVGWFHACGLDVGHYGDHSCGHCVETWPQFVPEKKAE